MEGYMPGCCSCYSESDLARANEARLEEKIKDLEKQVTFLKHRIEWLQENNWSTNKGSGMTYTVGRRD